MVCDVVMKEVINPNKKSLVFFIVLKFDYKDKGNVEYRKFKLFEWVLGNTSG